MVCNARKKGQGLGGILFFEKKRTGLIRSVSSWKKIGSNIIGDGSDITGDMAVSLQQAPCAITKWIGQTKIRHIMLW